MSCNNQSLTRLWRRCFIFGKRQTNIYLKKKGKPICTYSSIINHMVSRVQHRSENRRTVKHAESKTSRLSFMSSHHYCLLYSSKFGEIGCERFWIIAIEMLLPSVVLYESPPMNTLQCFDERLRSWDGVDILRLLLSVF